MIERDTRLPILLLPLMGLVAVVAAGIVDFARYRLRLNDNSTFEPHPTIVLGAISAGALVVAAFLVAVARLSQRRSTSTR